MRIQGKGGKQHKPQLTSTKGWLQGCTLLLGIQVWVQLYLHICGRLIGDIKFSGTKRRKSKWKIRCNGSQDSAIERNWKGCRQLYLCWRAEDMIGPLVQTWRWCTSSNNKTKSINPVPWYISQMRSDAAISKYVDSRGEWCCGMSDAGTLVRPDKNPPHAEEFFKSNRSLLDGDDAIVVLLKKRIS